MISVPHSSNNASTKTFPFLITSIEYRKQERGIILLRPIKCWCLFYYLFFHADSRSLCANRDCVSFIFRYSNSTMIKNPFLGICFTIFSFNSGNSQAFSPDPRKNGFIIYSQFSGIFIDNSKHFGKRFKRNNIINCALLQLYIFVNNFIWQIFSV